MTLSTSQRAADFAGYARFLRQSGQVESLSLFTLPGGAQDASKPHWWFVTPEIVAAVRDVMRLPIEAPPAPPAPPADLPSTSTPEPPTVPSATGAKIMTVRDLREIRWRAHVPGLPYNEDAAFEQHWLEHAELGSPLTGELPLDDGRVAMVFANGERAWSAEKGVETL